MAAAPFAMAAPSPIEVLPTTTVLIVGGGPVGLTLATTLARHGVRSVLLERSLTTTRWPKMDLTTARSLEIFDALGLAHGLRQHGVPSRYSFTCRFSTGLHADSAVTTWDLPSVDALGESIATTNDGSMPAEPWQRISQQVFEAWLRDVCVANPLIDFRAGCEVQSAHENEHDVCLTYVDVRGGGEKCIQSQYVAACDGANSVLRKSMAIELDGASLPAKALSVHFKSRDLSRLHAQGQFWHIFFPNEAAHGGGVKGAVIAQDEVETWTVHFFLPRDLDEQQLSSEEAVYQVLGGIGPPYPIDIDQILLRSTWSPGAAIAQSYISPRRRILLAGDACHQFPPTGGYGMNTGIADAYDLGWKLAATVQKWGGPELLKSYDDERRPVGMLGLQWSKTHLANLSLLSRTIELDAAIIAADTEAGRQMRYAMQDYLQTHDGHNKSIGVEMGYRYESSICVPNPGGPPAPDFDPRKYTPTVFPGHRAPHVFLTTGKSILHEFGKGFTLVLFLEGEASVTTNESFRSAAKKRHVPLKAVQLSHEMHAGRVWGAGVVLVRPDGFVSWSSDLPVCTTSEADEILAKATGLIK